MSYFAAAVVRDADEWSVSEVSLTDAADIEDVADRLRDVAPAADVSLLFVESDESYLAILRLDQGEDLRIFGSDVAFAEESRLGALLLGEVGSRIAELEAVDLAQLTAEPDSDESGDAEGEISDAAASGDADPAGDPDLLADLGVPAQRLLELCTHNGILPSDITAEVCQVIGCADQVEELRVP